MLCLKYPAGRRQGARIAGKLKRKVIRLGVAGTLAALSVAAVGIPAQAADVQPAKPGIAVESAALPAANAPSFVEAAGLPEVGGEVFVSHGGGGGSGEVKVGYQWLRNGVSDPGRHRARPWCGCARCWQAAQLPGHLLPDRAQVRHADLQQH